MQKLLDKPLPNDVDAERSALGCILLTNDLLNQARGQITANDFFQHSHRAIYTAMLKLGDEGRAIDPIALADLLRQAGTIDQIGGVAYIGELFDGVPRFSDITNYLRIIREKAVMRELIRTAHRIEQSGLDGELDAREQLAQARKGIEAIADPEGVLNWHSAEASVSTYLDHVSERIASGTRYDGLATGLVDLDEEMWGLPWGTITLVAARPGMGKTTLLTQMAESIAASPHNSDTLVLFFSLEMTAIQLVQRMAGSASGIPIRRLRTLQAWQSEGEKRLLKQAVDQIAALPFLIDETPGLTPGRFAAEVRRIQRENKGKKIVAMIDYVQQMQADERSVRSAYDRATAISQGLTRATKELGIVTIAAAQLNRASESRGGNRPTMADLRDSGQWEQDAAAILFPHRPSYYDQDRVGSKAIEIDAEIIVGKGRFSGNSVIPMHFNPTCARYLVPGSYQQGGRNDF